MLSLLTANFFKKIFHERYQSVKYSLDPNQNWPVVCPDLGPNCLQRLSGDFKSRHFLSQLCEFEIIKLGLRDLKQMYLTIHKLLDCNKKTVPATSKNNFGIQTRSDCYYLIQRCF